MTEKALETRQEQRAVVLRPLHLHQTFDQHIPAAGCRAACGYNETGSETPEQHYGGIPQDACPSCADAAIFGGGTVCWGPR